MNMSRWRTACIPFYRGEHLIEKELGTWQAGYRLTQDILLKVSRAEEKKKNGVSQKENGQTDSKRMER